MIRHLALALACAALPFLAAAQPNAEDAARAAEVVAARAAGAFERVDPDTEMPRPDDEAAAVYAGLPPLTREPAPQIRAADVIADEAAAPRGPAARMIANEVVQPLPTPAPAPVAAAAPAPTAVAARAASDPFVIKSILPIEGSIRYGDWFWDESAAPATGKLVITVDLEARVISAFRDGHEIGTAVALLGTQAHPTPLGSFPVLNKSRQHFSRKYNNAPMPHSLWITNTGIAIHGSPVMNGYASHGCIGVPDEFAAKLFAAAKRGDRVIITRGKMVGVGDKIL
jgi:lipoprotein-anchoring transpeptidase ErfK/SrfK